MWPVSATVHGAAGDWSIFRPVDVRGHLVRTGYRPAADFECSNKLLNDIYRITRWTFENLSLGGYYVIKALLDAGRDDLIYETATKEDYPSWGDMLRRGATTLWESWEGDISLLHSSYLHLGLWFIEAWAAFSPTQIARASSRS